MGWVYNLKDQNAPTQAPRMIAVCLTFSSVAVLAACLRLYVRIKTKRGVWVDDYSAITSAILGAAYTGVAVAQTRWGQALDSAYFPPENTIPFSKVQYVGGPLYTLALLGFKLALLTSYLRIGGFVALYRYIIYGTIAAVTCNQVIFTFIITLACHPVSKQWNPAEPGSCIDTLKSYYAIAGTSIGFDLIIILLPMPVLWKLQLHIKQKLVLSSLFALGFFVTAIQIIRIFTIANLKNYTNSQAIVIWSCIEISLGVIIACVPTYGPLFRAFSSSFNSYRTPHRDNSYPLNPRHDHGQGSDYQRKNGRGGRSQDWEYSLHDRTTEEHGVHKTTVMSLAKSRFQGDASSEEHILPFDEPEQGANGYTRNPIKIHTTMEVSVESHNGSSVEDLHKW